jgi:hypothetical protein
MNRWIRGTSFSHNLVTVDDQEQPLRSREPSFRMMVTSPRVSVVEASSRVYPQCRDYRRMVILVKGPGAETFVVDIFRVKGGARHTYRLFSELAASDAKGGSRVYPDLDLEPDGPLPDFGASVDPAHIFGLRDARRVENPPPAWQAIWQERGRRYRLRMLSPVDAVEVSNGPGQETLSQIGRRVRYLDAIRTGEDLASAFVAIHEPVGPGGVMPVRGAERVVVSDRAGPDAVALRIVSRWGTYLIFSDVDGEVEVDGIRFEGAFGVHCRTSEGRRWILAAGARTMAWTEGGRAAGFSGAPAGWSGRIRSHTEKAIETDEERPAGWPRLPQGVESYVRIGSGQGWTGFPVRSTGRRRVAVGRFSLQGGDRFDLPAVRCREEGLG